MKRRAHLIILCRKFYPSIQLLILILLSAWSFGQTSPQGTLQGKLIDSIYGQNVGDATISVFNKNDSSLVAYGLSKKDGSFIISRIPFGNYFFEITFSGYESIDVNFSLTVKKPLFDAGKIYLHQKANILQDVLVKAVPIVVKGDTTEFNASSYKTIPNATAEDLLKKLPGMEVEKDGTVSSQGEKVTRVLVDGKRFFGKDPKMATRNLPVDIIDKIQVIDALSEESEFSGFDDGERIKTINILTKKDKKKVVFGKGSIAAGNEGRYAGGASANKFDGSRQISFITQSNNINNQNFSVEDFLGTMNTGNAKNANRPTTQNGTGVNNIFAGNASGISTASAGGGNYNDVWGKKTEVNGSYFFNQINTTNNRDRYRETFVINDSSLFNTSHLLSESKNSNHRFNFQAIHNIDSANALLIQPNFSYQGTDINSDANSSTVRGLEKPLNTAKLSGNSGNEGINFNNSIMFRHRFPKRGRTYSLNFTQNFNTNNRNTYNLSAITRNWGRQDTIDQVGSTIRDGKGWGLNARYTEPISASSLLEFSYRYNRNKNTSDQQTYRLDDITDLYTVIVSNLTNDFHNSHISHRIGVSYKKQVGQWWNYSIGIALQHAILTSENLTKQSYLQHSFNNLFPTFNLQYRKGKFKNLRFIYLGITQQPTIMQLQDVIINTNALHIRTGNPNLLQEFNNNFTLRYNSFNPGTLTNFTINLGAELVSNKIVNSTTINTTNDSMIIDGYSIVPGAQFTRPVNMNGAFNARANFNYSFPVRSLGGTIHLISRFQYDRNLSMVNNERSFIHDYLISGIFRLTMNLNERFDLNFSANSSYDILKYTQRTDRTGNFFTQRFSIEPTYSSKSGWIISNDFEYIINRGQSEGYNQSIPLWNAGIAKLFLKKQQAELRLTTFDLLNQNMSITRIVEQNYVEDIKSQALNRYFLLSFTYYLRNSKGVKNVQGKNRKNSAKNFRESK